jgi:uncharacterized Zn finger protein
VQCTRCDTVHHAVVREAADVELPVVVSAGAASARAKLTLSGDDALHLGDELIVDGVDTRLTGIESRDGRRVDAAVAKDVGTLWVKRFDQVTVGVAINLDKKTIAKELVVEPTRAFTVGEELLFGRLRVTVHAIKTEERLLKRGSAEAGEIRRVFARPTPLGRGEPRPDKRTREQLRARAERRRSR